MKYFVFVGDTCYCFFPDSRLSGSSSLSPLISNLDRLAFSYCGFGCSVSKCDHPDKLCINCINHF